MMDVAHDKRALGIGDFTWIVSAMYKGHKEEFMMDYIIERKAANDFESSHFNNHLRD